MRYLWIVLLLLGCGGGGSSDSEKPLLQGTFVDAIVTNLEYNTSSGIRGFTDNDGKFEYYQNDKISFYLGNNCLGTIPAKSVITPVDLAENNSTKYDLIAYILQNLDTDANPYNNQIVLPDKDTLSALTLPLWNQAAIEQEVKNFKNSLNLSFPNLTITEAHNILAQNLIYFGYSLSTTTTTTTQTTTGNILNIGTLYDAYVSNMPYTTSSGVSGITNNYGKFNYDDNDTITFYIGDFPLGTIEANNIITPIELAEENLTKAITIAYLLQNLDTDGNAGDNILMLPNRSDLIDLNLTSLKQSEVEEKLNLFKEKTSFNFPTVTRFEAYKNLYNNLTPLNYVLPSIKSGTFIDDIVVGLEYNTTYGFSGITDSYGNFHYIKGEKVTFKIGDFILGTTEAKDKVTPYELADGNLTKLNLIAYILQNLDTTPTTPQIDLPDTNTLQHLNINSWSVNDVIEGVNNFKELITQYTFADVTMQQAYQNIVNSLKNLGYVLPNDPNYPAFSPMAVEVFTTAPVFYAKVTDANGQVAEFNASEGIYYFNNYVTFPIKAEITPDTFVDVDFDKKKTANDIKPTFTTLYSNQFSETNNSATITLLSNFLYNTSTNQEDIEHRFNITIPEAVFDKNYNLLSENYTMLLLAFYNQFITNNFTPSNILTDYEPYFNNLVNFKNDYLTGISTSLDTRMKYLIFYNSLLQLDKHLLSRVDYLHSPTIPSILRDPYSAINTNNNFPVFDIELDKINSYVITAIGQDESAVLNSSLSSIFQSTPPQTNNYFGRYLSKVNETCFILSDNSNFRFLNTNNLTLTDPIYSIPTEDANLTIATPPTQYLQQVKIFYSPLKNKYILTINTLDPGVQFVAFDVTDEFNETNCSLKELNASKQIIPYAQFSNTITYDTTLRKNYGYIYISSSTAIFGADITSFEPNTILSTITGYSMPDGVTPFKLKIDSTSNELFISTNKGAYVYDIYNDNTLSTNPRSVYLTEGSMSGYIPDIDLNNDYLIYTDGFFGVKIIKYDNNYQPMLCGVAYFKDLLNHPIKVNSVKFDENSNYLYVGYDNGIVKIDFDSILFKHCKE